MARSKLSQRLAVLQAVAPASLNTTTNMTGIDTSLHRKVLFIVQNGVLGTSATVDFKLQASATSGGTYADIGGKAITQMVKASDDSHIAKVEIMASEMPAGKPFVRGVLTTGTAASLVAVVALGGDERYEPASSYDNANVTQTVS
jgi:hypothetical protein